MDPGSRTTGWGIVDRDRGRYVLVAAGAIRAPEGAMGPRLLAIHRGLTEAIAAHRPDVSAIEAIFSHKSAASALVLGQARGVALLTLCEAGLAVHEYNASAVKSTVAGSGRAEKAQVGRMVQALLGVPVPGPADTADALAIALTHHALAWRANLPGK